MNSNQVKGNEYTHKIISSYKAVFASLLITDTYSILLHGNIYLRSYWCGGWGLGGGCVAALIG